MSALARRGRDQRGGHAGPAGERPASGLRTTEPGPAGKFPRDTVSSGGHAAGAPAEAVDPATLAPRAKGHKTERSEGGPLSSATRQRGTAPP
ncbi:DUF6009 family protein [Streptomyces sp. SM11]|uniref:DUF6009 family protein n=1 Tax=Streptomyces sp. SM11 TaxID=565557 RepID=UPI0021562B58|nr:DUF6009 family protein [Streptomyces sp. SM11]